MQHFCSFLWFPAFKSISNSVLEKLNLSCCHQWLNSSGKLTTQSLCQKTHHVLSMCLSHPLNLIKSSSPSMTLGRRVLQSLIDLLTLFLKQQTITQKTQQIMANMIRPIIIHDMSPSEMQSSLSGDGEAKKAVTDNLHFLPLEITFQILSLLLFMVIK